MTTLFKVTDAGLAAAAQAVNLGIKVRLTTFKIGSASGYTPSGTETALHGSVLYTAAINSYKDMPDGSLVFICTLDPQAGPFDFGEIGLFTDAGVLFALAAFPNLQTKYTSLSTNNINSTFTLNCHIRLAQGTSVFETSAVTNPAYEVYVRWRDIKVPSQMPDPRVTRLLVSELDSKGNVASLVQTPSNGWSIQSNLTCLSSSLTSLGTSSYHVWISVEDWQTFFPGLAYQTVPLVDFFSTLVIQFQGSVFTRVNPSINTIAFSYPVIQLDFDLDSDPPFIPAPPLGTFSLWSNYTGYLANYRDYKDCSLIRANSTYYINSTGSDITVIIGFNTGAISATVNYRGLPQMSSANQNTSTVYSFDVPKGLSYRVDGFTSGMTWWEMSGSGVV